MSNSLSNSASSSAAAFNAALVLESGKVFYGQGIGATGQAVGEVCFNTGLSGYQETLTDPSYAGQLVTFTFPHIGNVGANAEDEEAAPVFRAGLYPARAGYRTVKLALGLPLHGLAETPGAGGLASRYPRLNPSYPRGRSADRYPGASYHRTA